MAGKRTMKGPDGVDHEIESIGFRSSGEHFNEYLLDDGTVLKVKLVLTDVSKILDMKDQQGKPIYMLNHQQVTSIDPVDE